MANTKRRLNREMKNIIIYFLTTLILFSCSQTEKQSKAFDKNKQTQILTFSKALFDRKIIDSKNVLDSLALIADNIMEDTAKYMRTPKANLYISTSTNTCFKIFENPKGIISAIAFYLNGKKLNVAEYYQNGQVMCRFKVDEDGKRNGPYECYQENGTYRHLGYYQNDKEISDSLKRFTE
jgi:hypothetical protein